MSEITRVFSQIESGDPKAPEQLLPLVYDELRKLAAAKLAQEKPGQTLQATALVHEAYLRLRGPTCRTEPEAAIDPNSTTDPFASFHPGGGTYNSRAHFFAAAAEAMRRILVENARRKGGPKAGGGHRRIELSDVAAEMKETDIDLVALSESLDKLQTKDPRSAELVKLRFFAGLTRHQAADVLGISVATADNDWAYAKGWLKSELTRTSGSG